MNQSFNSQQLNRFCKQGEYFDYGITLPDLKNLLDKTSEKIVNDDFNFNIIQTNAYYLTNDLPHKLVLRKLNDNLKRLYKDEQANRRIIISQVKTLLEETCPFWVLKTDIKSFYESIDRDRIIEKFQDDSMLSYYSIYLLKKLFSNDLLLNFTGVPRGLNVSATLSEIYMRKFDRWIRRFNGVYYYARFVDDIIIFTNSNDAITNLIKNINTKLEECAKGLIKNESKTVTYIGNAITSNKPLEYLGYKFTKKIEAKKAILKVTIADKKVKKIKTRIVLTFFDFIKNKDFPLLENRIKFLTGNYSIKKNREGNDLRAGIYYNYIQVTDLSVFDDLNDFYRKALFSRNKKFGRKLSNTLSPLQRERLNRYCFKTGFTNKVYNSFTAEEMAKIISCW